MFAGSNAVRTAELMLAHKAIAYEEVVLRRGAHMFVLRAHGFRGVTVPALKIDARRVQRTRAISRALDALEPEPPLFPADPVARAAVEDAERWGEELQDALRRLFYCAVRRSRPDLSGRLAATRHRATDAAGRRDAAALPERLDQIDAWIAAGLLDGRELNAADFQIAPNVAGLLSFAEFAPFIEGRPAAAHARRVAGEHPRRREDPILPDEWLEPLRSAASSSSVMAR